MEKVYEYAAAVLAEVKARLRGRMPVLPKLLLNSCGRAYSD